MFNRFEALKQAIEDGNSDFAMLLADFHMVKGTISNEQYTELETLSIAYEQKTTIMGV